MQRILTSVRKAHSRFDLRSPTQLGAENAKQLLLSLIYQNMSGDAILYGKDSSPLPMRLVDLLKSQSPP